MKIKGKFPDEDSLREYIDNNIDKILERTKEEIGHLEDDYKRADKSLYRTVLIIIFLVLAFWAMQFFDIFSTGSYLALFIIVLLSAVQVYKKIKKSLNVIKRFNNSVNYTLMPIALSFFDLEGRLHPPFGRDVTSELLNFSQLITEPKNTIVTDDFFQVDLVGNKLNISELDVSHVTKHGKNRTKIQIFKGYFISLDLDSAFRGRTFISTEGDSGGFGHQSFWNKLTGSGTEVTELEWNDFENLLRVATTNPKEAREILTPDFMSNLYDWWHSKKQNIRISFLGTRMYMLFPDDNIRFNQTVTSLSQAEIQDYLESIAIPLLHVLQLIEDVQEKFNHQS